MQSLKVLRVDAALRYAYARAGVTLDAIPNTAPVLIGARHWAMVWMNGVYIGRTYVRHHDDEWRVESFDLATHLRPGANVLAMQLHAWGAPEDCIPGVQLPDAIGYCLSGRLGGVDLSEPSAWRIAEATDYRPARRHNGLIGHEERRDMRLEPQGWREPGFDDSAWGRPEAHTLPGATLCPSILRPLREEFVTPRRIVAIGSHRVAVALEAKSPRSNLPYWRIAFSLESEAALTFFYRRRYASRLWVNGVEQPFEIHPPFPWVEQYHPVPLELPAGRHCILGLMPPAGEFQQPGQPFGWAECPQGGAAIEWAASPEGPFTPGSILDDPIHRPMIDTLLPDRPCPVLRDGFLDWRIENSEQAAIFEFERSLTILPVIEIADATAGAEIDLIYSERLSDTPGLTFPGVYTDRAILRGGAQTVAVSFQYKSARELKLIVRARGGCVSIRRVGAVYRHYDYDRTGLCRCEDERLNAVWEICRNTMEFGSQDVIVDGPWREQILYIGDNYVHNLACYHLFGNHEIVEWQHLLYARGQMPDGIFQPNQPCRTPPEQYRLLDQTILWPIQLEHHLLHTGREAFIAGLLPCAVKLMDGFNRRFALPDDPRLREVTGWNWVDHPGIEDGRVRSIRHEGIPTAINLLQTLALDSLTALLRSVGQTADAERLSERARGLRDTLRARHWNAERNVFADCVVEGKPSPEASIHVNLLAILAGMCERPSELLDRTWNRPGILQMCGPFFRIHLFEVLHRLDRIPEMLAEMRSLWGGYVDAGLTSTPEFSAINGEWGSSVGHPWGASPAVYLVKSIAGLSPTAPGWARTRFHPRLCDLRRFRVVVPTPFGAIEAELCREGDSVAGTLSVPEPIELDVASHADGVRIVRTRGGA